MQRIIQLIILLTWWLYAFSCQAAQALTGGNNDYDALLSMIGESRIVMLGEATHGSREFYRERARITRRLIEEAGFGAVVLEAPWESVRRLDAYIRGDSNDADAAAALGDFVRFPRWSWRNREVRDFLEILRAINLGRAPGTPPVRIYGMDLYSEPESAEAVVRHLARRSSEAAALARQRYVCFADYVKAPMLYGRDAESGQAVSCAEGVAAQLAEMETKTGDEDDFAAWQSARVVHNGEGYYRALYRPGAISWNLREQHMADTLVQILERVGAKGQIVVWAHNSHQGDARHSDQGEVGELSLGQLMRERYGTDAVLIGFSTYHGQVRAAANWGGKDRVWRLRPALRQSWHARLHRLGLSRRILIFRDNPALAAQFAKRRLERVVGVSYVPNDERGNHYRHSYLSRQFDAVIHIDRTSAVDSM
ncbi:MAG TPA: erythromycin esterase [Desulfobulbaceae bacterium]|nr:MAG: hypothetical protein A2520_11480 [Deltaproteobacteria bacterium RIFOXYD12_FULL_53_23]HCC54469.1 erythromycin esterase [Desulfobulbaceae bacterium]